MNSLNVIGQGYIGLPTALMFASAGIPTVGSDNSVDVIEKLKSGNLPIKEKGLEDLYKKALEKNIRFSTEYIETDTYIIAVPTPFDKNTYKLDVSYVLSALEGILDVCLNDAVIIIESTIAPGTIDKYIRPVIEDRKLTREKTIHIVHAPERIIPGNMVFELINNSRTIGADSHEVGRRVANLYSSFCKGEIHITDIRSA
mgnify:CR=1 FL=1